MSDILAQIQALQFTDKAAAEGLLTAFLRDTLNLEVTAVELRPFAVSLNSFNGFMHSGGWSSGCSSRRTSRQMAFSTSIITPDAG